MVILVKWLEKSLEVNLDIMAIGLEDITEKNYGKERKECERERYIWKGLMVIGMVGTIETLMDKGEKKEVRHQIIPQITFLMDKKGWN